MGINSMNNIMRRTGMAVAAIINAFRGRLCSSHAVRDSQRTGGHRASWREDDGLVVGDGSNAGNGAESSGISVDGMDGDQQHHGIAANDRRGGASVYHVMVAGERAAA